jgi:hypothetical protein
MTTDNDTPIVLIHGFRVTRSRRSGTRPAARSRRSCSITRAAPAIRAGVVEVAEAVRATR